MKKAIKHVKNISLSSQEKESMFSRIDLYTKENPMKEIVAHPSAWYNLFGQVGQVKGYRYMYSALALIVTVFVGAGVTNAAEKSLPGDTLYPVKINVNEKVKSAVAFTSKAKTKVEEEKVIRRLDEVEALVKKGEFKNGKRDQLEKEVEKSVKVLNNKVDRKDSEDVKYDKVEENNDDDDDFEDKLNTRFEKIKKVDNNVDKDEVEKFEKKFKERLLDRSNRDGRKNKNKNNYKDI